MLESLSQIPQQEWLPLLLVFTAIALTVFVMARLVVRLNKTNRVTSDPQVIGPPPNAFGEMTDSLSRVFPHSNAKRAKIHRELSDAGYHHSNALINFLSLRNVASMAWLMLVAMAFFSGLADGHELEALAIAVAIGIFVHSLPRIILSTKATSRLRQIEYGLPDALDMLAMSVEGGLPLSQSLQRVAVEIESTHGALHEELRIIARQTRTGSFDVALKSFANRIQLPQLMAWSALMQQSQRLGGDVVTGLREYADRIRNDRKTRADRMGQTASVKMLLPVVLFLAPPVFVILVGPALLDFRDFIQRERENQSAIIQEAQVPQAARLQEAFLGDTR